MSEELTPESSTDNDTGFKEIIFISIIQQKLLQFIGEALDHLAILLVFYAVICLILYKFIFHILGKYVFRTDHFPEFKGHQGNKQKSKEPSSGNVLLITAHPDDESMFFGPTILALRRRNCRVFVLCLSHGNRDQKGELRRLELWDACEYLEIQASDVTLMNVTLLPDDPTVEWKTITIATMILKQIESLEIELLITFDKDGISNHPNHCAIYYAVASLCLSGMIPNSCRVLTLETVNICRKYLSIFDLPITLLLSTNWSILKWSERALVQRAMKKHKSQMVWFRRLYIVFSRYMVINSLRELTQSDVEFELLDT